MRTLIAALILVAITVAPAGAQSPCPCVPVTHFWIVKTCTDWNCALAELLPANGDPQVMAMPVSMGDARWLVVRRAAAGAAIDTTNDPFQVDQFDGMAAAVARFDGFYPEHKPMLISAPDGRFLVIALRQPEVAPARRRAAVP